jgi:hypothetical protein
MAAVHMQKWNKLTCTVLFARSNIQNPRMKTIAARNLEPLYVLNNIIAII